MNNSPDPRFESLTRDVVALRWNVLHCIGLCTTLFFNGYDGSLMNGLQSITAWQEHFNYPSSNILGLMNSAGFLPGLIVCFLADRLAHKFGKLITVWIGSCIAAIGAIVIGLAQNTGMFIGGRALMGVGVQGTLVVAPALLQEIAHPRYRARIGALYMSIYYFASTISAAVCRGCLNLQGEKAWRIPCLLQVVGPVLAILMTLNAPESPRWLEKNGRSADALRVLAKYHANGDENDALVIYEHREIKEALAVEELNSQTKYTDYLKGSGNRHRLLILVIVSLGTNWVGNGIISYYLSPILTSLGITSTSEQLNILIGLQVFNFVISVLASMAVDRVGRRPLWIGSTAGMLVLFSILMGLSAAFAQNQVPALGKANIPFLFLFLGAYDPLALSYPVEILTYTMRTKGQAIFVFLQTLGMSVNTWVNPIALEALQWKYYGVYVVILVAVLVIIFFWFPETKNLTIEEIAVIFDGERALGGTGRPGSEDGGRSTPPKGTDDRVEFTGREKAFK
ncbi:unnamed protein product [Clonostachys rosea]|uniref:Major facilitator superfamily (MFS) profile domain-containing protein n=1 Tax=Bionectria ochroleuca TaxID=29856 RepID=A0ABY6UEK7_BIOOC|nr:unnamed protein product [Clonostachys rosea]